MTTHQLLAEKDNCIRERDQQLQAQQQQIQEQQQEISELKQKVTMLEQAVALERKRSFGRKSEQSEPVEQMSLFNEAEQEASAKSVEPQLTETPVKAHIRKKKFQGQKEQLLSTVPHEEQLHTLPEEERVCAACGAPLSSMGKELIRTEIQFIPAKLRIIDHVRETFECRQCRSQGHPTVVKPVLPNPVLPHSSVSASAIAHVMVQKYQNGLPLYRQEQEWRDLGLELHRATLANWILGTTREWLQPLADRMHQDLLQQPYLHADETVVQVLHAQGRQPNKHQSYMWVYSTGKYGCAHAIRLFEYQPGRSGDAARVYLDSFAGYLHTDGYAGYHKVTGVTHCYCWSHVRRKFHDAATVPLNEQEGTLAKEAVHQINRLFELEKSVTDLNTEERKQARIEKEKPILSEFWQWIGQNQGRILPKSALGKAMAYAVNIRKGLEAYLEDGNCEISNNIAENIIRPFTIGRKNWLFCNSTKGAQASAAVYSLIETCKANDVDAFRYLQYVMEQLPNVSFRQNPATLDSYLPWSKLVKEHCK